MGKFSVLNFAWKKRENSAVEAIKIRSRVDSLKNMKILVDSFGKKRRKIQKNAPIGRSVSSGYEWKTC